MNKQDCYKILEIDENASLEDIKNVYKKFVLEFHPDRTQKLSEKLQKLTENRLKEINAAYESILNNSFIEQSEAKPAPQTQPPEVLQFLYVYYFNDEQIIGQAMAISEEELTERIQSLIPAAYNIIIIDPLIVELDLIKLMQEYDELFKKIEKVNFFKYCCMGDIINRKQEVAHKLQGLRDAWKYIYLAIKVRENFNYSDIQIDFDAI